MKQQVNYCIVLSAERLKFLAESKYGIDRMKILHQLIRSVSLKETEYNIKGFHTTIHVGQAAISEVELSNRLHYDKKTISRLLDQMNQLGIVATEQSNRTSVHTLKCISAWMVDGQRTTNPFYVQIKDRPSSEQIHERNASQNFKKIVTSGEEHLATDSKRNFRSQSSETVPTEPCGSPISFPILDLQPPVYSDNGELLIPSGEENVVGNDAASQPTDTNESPTNRTDHSMPDIEGSSSGCSTTSSTDLSNDRTVENGSTAPDNTSRALPSINQRTTDYVFPQPLAEEESQPLVLAE